MILSEQTTVYVTADNQRFFLLEDAVGHERRCVIRKFVERTGMGSGGDWTPSMIAAVISDELPELLQDLEKCLVVK